MKSCELVCRISGVQQMGWSASVALKGEPSGGCSRQGLCKLLVEKDVHWWTQVLGTSCYIMQIGKYYLSTFFQQYIFLFTCLLVQNDSGGWFSCANPLYLLGGWYRWEQEKDLQKLKRRGTELQSNGLQQHQWWCCEWPGSALQASSAPPLPWDWWMCRAKGYDSAPSITLLFVFLRCEFKPGGIGVRSVGFADVCFFPHELQLYLAWW